jgi:NRPS condensation-like uncharacterized protein
MNRKLDMIEQLIWLIDQVAGVNFGIIACVSGALTEQILRKSLDIVQQKYPSLKSKIVDGHEPGFVFEDVPQIPLRTVERRDDHHWIEEIEKGMKEPFPWSIGPLVRVVLLVSKDKCDLVFSFCHIIGDGISGIKFVEDVLKVAGQLCRGETPPPVPTLPILPSFHDLIRKDLKFKPGFLDIPGRIMRIFHKPVGLKGDQEVPPEKRSTRVIQRTISPAETKKLSERCKKEKSTIQGVLCAAVLQTLVEEIRKSQDVPQRGSLMIGCNTPVNSRHYLSMDVGDNMGNFVANAFHFQLVDNNSSIWSTARKVKKSIQREIKFGRDIKAIQALDSALKANSTPMDVLKTLSEAVPPVGVSNMGQLDITGQFGDLILEDIHATGTINISVKSGFALVVTSFHGHITINFLYAEPYRSKERAEIMVKSVMKRLKEAIK